MHHLPAGETVFAGQRHDGFFVDLGSIFDLGDLRPFQNLHLIPSPATPGVDALSELNVHTIAIQVPITQPDPRRLRPDRPDPSEVGDRRLGRAPAASGRR